MRFEDAPDRLVNEAYLVDRSRNALEFRFIEAFDLSISQVVAQFGNPHKLGAFQLSIVIERIDAMVVFVA
jgi:hypothetical protein